MVPLLESPTHGRAGFTEPRIAVGGTGGIYLASREWRWARDLLSLANAHDRRKISDHVIADRLATLNFEAHRAVADSSVGPRCIVVWRRRPDARPGAAGGGHRCYTGTESDRDLTPIPAISNGIDVGSIGAVYMAQMRTRLSDHPFDPGTALDVDPAEMNRLLASLPSDPDEHLS